MVTFDCGNDIFEEGDEPKGIYIIISGMIKVKVLFIHVLMSLSLKTLENWELVIFYIKSCVVPFIGQ